MISRRKMIRSLAGYTAGSLLLNNAFATTKKSPHPVGLQLYTLRSEISKDARGTLKKVSDLGFKEVENFGYNGKFFGMDAKTYRDMLNGMGLTTPSGHYMYGNFGNKQIPGTIITGWDKAVEDAAALGQKYMVVAYLMPEERKSLDDYKKIAAELNKAGETCKKAGIQLCYHNHDFEFQAMEGSLPFDLLMSQTDSKLVKAELDLYWAVKANQQPLDLFKKYPKRIELWHVKDMDNTDKKFFTEVGSGTIDFTSIFKANKKSGMKHFFVEQDQCPGSPFVSIEKSIGYISSNLVKLV
ncbi:MAG: sugar phosphate isomerase/epimerase family protein [Chitinophagaceae bacterium]